MSVRLVGLAHLLLAAVLAMASIAFAGWARPDPGVTPGEPGATVSWVLPGGPSWRDGLRAGQVVVELTSGTDMRTWRIATTDGQYSYATGYARQEAVLRGLMPTALLAAALAGLGFLFFTRLAIATAAAAASLLFSSTASAATGYELFSSVVQGWAVIVPLAWLVSWGTRSSPIRLILIATGVVTVGWWLGARYSFAGLFEPAELARQGVTLAADLTMLILLADWGRWRRQLHNIDGTRAADAVAVGLVLALTVFVGLVLELPMVLLVAFVGSLVLLHPRFRRRLAMAIDQIVLGEVRDRASIRAVEEERGRIARDLHDAPLQEIAAVIRQLDRKPEARRETELLRGVAERLRKVTIELRPPILDDLGLSAALAYLGEQAHLVAPDLDVRVELLPEDLLSARAPAEVELAFFRIVQEAVDNAIKHGEAKALSITATVQPDDVAASVEDDGRGIQPAAARQAARAGHVGLISMTQRASLIGADIDISSRRPHGTRVRVHWRAEA